MIKFSSKNTIDPDNLSPFFIKNLASSISQPLALTFQISINEGILPSIWKIDHVIPLFKGKGSKYNAPNHRTINLYAS